MNISFIIPAFNAASFLKESIDSIMDGNFSDGDEIIIVDDASNDNTYEIAIEYAQRFPFVNVLKHLINKGSAAAGRNTGIENAQNDLIFCLDADNILEENSVLRLSSFLLENKLDAASFGEIRYFIDSTDKPSHVWQMDKEISFLGNINRYQHSPCSSGNYLFSKKSWIRAGRYNEGIGGAMDSWAFGLAQLATGCRMQTMPESFYYHRIGYDSTYIKEIERMSLSLSCTRILLSYLDLIDPRDIDYILLRANMHVWFENLSKRPLRPRIQDVQTTNLKMRLSTLLKRVRN